ncbi:MAG: ABC transporter permease [Pseudodesulfovibrio sp.]|uniref:Lipopolysaccharide transport system permease protein n=1 Tax=Pseudodesulfovibrio indicus TaxID=1716143 RepID=A0A126QN89_9BACT|nr:ABC transporter permease [Pseudodesulfovibrio indicus]AMK11289.1 hypothetical protein AWY79_09250 [Pseudodesulfovibrio indicus]TDT85562.1 lipopolysaccharide transport system permease protein [Pseudodesulfovibrio indicus]
MLRLTRTLTGHRDALAALCGVGLKTTVATTRLGWLWWICDPLFMMGVYYFMVRLVFGRGGPDYHLFALTGIVCWQFFARTVLLTAGSLRRNGQLLSHSTVPPETFTVVPVLIQLFFALIGCAIIVAWHWTGIGPATLWLFPVLGVMGLYALALGALLSVFVVFMPDVSKFADYGLRAGFFLSPVLYPAAAVSGSDRVPELVKAVYGLNPMAWGITAMRGAILDGTSPDTAPFLAALAGGLVLLQLALAVLRANRQNVMKHL